MSVEQAYNFSAIDKTVSTSGLLSKDQLLEIAEEGYEAVINLLPHDSQYAVANEENIVNGQGVDYHSIPVDFAAPTEDDYAQFVAIMHACRGKKLLIHCAANYRVSAFYSMYAFEHLDWSAIRAREHIQSIWEPQDNPPWAQFIAQRIPEDAC